MRNAIVVFVGALSLLACSKDKPADDTTTTRGAMNEAPAMVSVEEVRTVLLEKRPGSSDAINALMITNDGGIVTLRGRVEDEATHADLINRARSMPNIRGVRDEITVMPRAAAAPMDTSGTTTTTGATPQPSPSGANTGSGMGGSTMGGSTGQGQTGSGAMGAGQTGAMSKSDAVRQSMTKARPKSEAVIQALTITDDGQIVTLSGIVPDETTHQALLKAAKDTTGVKTVKDDLKVPKKTPTKE